jgi:hypothetical protein
MADSNQIDDIRRGAQVLFKPGQLVEVRLRLKNDYWRGLYFTDHDRMATAVLALDAHREVQSIYYVFNRINPKLVEHRKACDCNKCVGGGLIIENPTDQQIERIINGPSQHLTGNEDVDNLNWLFIDVDTLRADGFEHESSSEVEKRATREVWKQVISFLDQRDWPSPMLADSGNGYHILCRINLPNSQNSIDMSIDCLRALASKFNSQAAKIDEAVFNGARLTRAYGTSTRKGTPTEERPYRRNRIVSKSGITFGPVNTDLIIALGSEAPALDRVRGDMPGLHKDFDLQKFFDWFGDQEAFSITGNGLWQGHEVKITDHCIIAGHKHTGSGLTGFIIGNTFGYHCFSDDCTGVTIGDVLAKLREDGYEPYPGKIWVEEDTSNFAEDVSALEAQMAQEKETFEVEAAEDLENEEDAAPQPVGGIVASAKYEDFQEDTSDVLPEIEEKAKEPEVTVPHECTAPIPKPGMKFCPACGHDLEKPYSQRLVGKEPNDLAERIMSIIFRDPQGIYTDFALFKQRFTKLAGFFNPTVSETFEVLLRYEEEIRHLPTKVELKDYVNNHPSCREAKKQQIIKHLDSLVENSAWTFDVTAMALIEEIEWRLEKKAVLKAHDALEKTRDIQAARTILRKHFASSMAIDSDFRPGSWQENSEQIYEAFRRDIAGEGEERKFRMGFHSIDTSGMSIGLDGSHAIVLYGPAANRKTTTALSLALNFAMQGKHGLFLCGEHSRMKIEKSLAIMFSHYLRKDPNDPNSGGIDVIPGLSKWEGLNKTADETDLANINQVLLELKTMRLVPGFLEVQNIDALARGSDDVWGAVSSYVDATYRKYQWDFVVIDPLDNVFPTEGAEKNHYQACCAIVDRMFSYTRTFAGDRGIMLVVTAQFKAEARRAIEKIQAKNTSTTENFDDEIEALLRQDSQIQYIGNKLTQRFDLGIGVACRVKNGAEGMLVQGRSREGGFFDSVQFNVDPDSNVVFEKSGAVQHVQVANGAAAASSPTDAIMPQTYDEL